jgi:transcriptional regulator with XRE-family HTH domain
MTDIINQLRKIRREREISQQALSVTAGLAQNQISYFETGRTKPTLPTLTLWAGALGYDLALKVKE